jgi:formate dehydrogenase major subunit
LPERADDTSPLFGFPAKRLRLVDAPAKNVRQPRCSVLRKGRRMWLPIAVGGRILARSESGRAGAGPDLATRRNMNESRTVATICPYCGVGCGMGLRVEGERVRGVEPLPLHPVSRGQLCAKGYSAAFGVDPIDRLTRPMVRRRGGFEAVSWDDAIGRVAEALRVAQEDAGPDAAGVIACARATNEDCYAVQKLARAVLGTNNVDHCARICHSPSVAGLRETLGSGAMTSSIADIAHASLVVCVGADATENHSIIGAQILAAKAAGAKLLVIDPRSTRLARLADLHIALRLGTDIALYNGLLHLIFARGLEARAFLDARCEGEAALREHVAGYTPERVSAVTGVGVAELQRAVTMLHESHAAFFAYGLGVTQHACATNNVIALCDLVLVTGHIGRPGTGLNPLRGQNNVQGACDMGALPNVYPGYQDALAPATLARFGEAWGREMPARRGLTTLGMMRAARERSFRALVLFGEDPVITDPDQHHVRGALRALDFLCVVELTMTETAREADVILPAASFAEKDGTFVNCERRVQRIRRAVPPIGFARTDWQIAADIARALGSDALSWRSAEEIFDEMVRLTPIYSAMTYARLGREGLQWPCDRDRPHGTPLLHTERFPRGRARLIAVPHVEPAEVVDEAYPLWLTTTRLHFHYGCGSMTRKSPLLERETPDGILFLHEEDARVLGLRSGSPVYVTSRRGRVATRAIVTDEVPRGVVAMPYHFKEAPSNLLTNTALDPVTQMPELKVCAVRVEPREEGEPASSPVRAACGVVR